MDKIDIRKFIDQTILKPDATEKDIRVFLDEVSRCGFYCAVVNPCWVPMAIKLLPKTIKVCSVVGFPLGASTTKAKVHAAHDLAEMGCDEIDMVMNIGRFKGKDFKYVETEMKQVRNACAGQVLKVIIETCLLTDEEKTAAARSIVSSGAQFVKTSTGFNRQGAMVEDIRLLRAAVGPDFGVKASGGIRTAEQARAMINAGATRLGTSSGAAIIAQTGS